MKVRMMTLKRESLKKVMLGIKIMLVILRITHGLMKIAMKMQRVMMTPST